MCLQMAITSSQDFKAIDYRPGKLRSSRGVSDRFTAFTLLHLPALLRVRDTVLAVAN